MCMSYYTSQNELLTLSQTPLGRGGEGTIYEVLSPRPYQGMVVKIYHPKEQTRARELKLLYMIANPLLQAQEILAWPQDTIYQAPKGESFAGYLMPKISNAIDLTQLCTPRLSLKTEEAWQEKFNRATLTGLQNRLEVCKNIAKAFAQIHQTQQYVFVDIKPENIKVSLIGEVTLLDLDSVAVIGQKQLKFPAQKASPEYSPAELKATCLPSEVIDETWDRFSLSVVFYKVLLGLHPFTGTCHPPFDKLDTYAQKIQEGLFPMGEKATQFRVIPMPHKAFYHLHISLQHLFKLCFEEGYKTPSLRPSAKTWVDAFEKIHVSQPLPIFSPQAGRRSFKNKLNAYQKKNNVSALIKSVMGGAALVATAMIFSVQLSSYKLPNSQKIEIIKNPLQIQALTPKELAKKYGFVNRFKDGAAKVLHKNKYGYINDKGEVIIDFKYDWADSFKDGAARVAYKNKFGAIDSKGEVIIPFKYDWIGTFNEGLSRVMLNGKTAYVNHEHHFLIDFRYDYGGDFNNGFAAVQKDEAWGFINKQGVEVIKPQFKEVLNFHEGLAAARKSYRWGFINEQGEWVIEPIYQEAFSFIEDRATVNLDGRNFEINLQGECIAFCPE